MSYFVPDRSDRPTDDGDPTGGTTEMGAGKTRTIELADGRVAVVEAASVDGFSLVYYYFDATGMEEATEGELREFLLASGIRLVSTKPDVESGFGASKTRDS